MQGKNRTLLLVDDDAEDRELFGQALHRVDQDVKLIEAFDGINALEKMSEAGFTPPDIIFLDLNMPRMNGKQFLAHWKELEPFRHIPIVIYSTSSRPADINYCMENGAAAYITKHCSFELLCKDLKQTLLKYLIKIP